MRTLCCSVRLKSLDSISVKAFKAEAYDGSSAIIPKSQVFGIDNGVNKSDAYWIAEWILQRKELQYSNKKQCWFDENCNMLPTYIITTHTPTKMNVVDSNIINELEK